MKKSGVIKPETERIFRYKRFDEYEKLCSVTMKELNSQPCFVEITDKDEKD